MNRRALLSGLAALPALVLASATRAAPVEAARAMPVAWEAFARHVAAWTSRARAKEARAAVVRAHTAGLLLADFSALSCGSGRPLTLTFGDWTAGTYTTVDASRVLRWNAEGPAERWG